VLCNEVVDRVVTLANNALIHMDWWEANKGPEWPSRKNPRPARTIMRCAIYSHVSTSDKGQETRNQSDQQRRYAEAQGWEVVEFTDHESGKHSNRPQFQALFAAASRREIDIVLVCALDRFSREGVAQTFGHIRRLLDYKVQFESLTEPHFRTTGPAGELMIAIAAWIAQQERIRISDRTEAGLATARSKGRLGGRPAKVFDRDRALAMRAQDPPVSWRKIASALKVPQSSLRVVLRKAA
jgi:DNA invertase Pin-like site-specific DNA recombinase